MYDKQLIFQRYPQLASCQEDMENALRIIVDCVKNGGKLLLCGNGGSCSDSDHIAGECLKGFLKKRSFLPRRNPSGKKPTVMRVSG